MIKGEIYNEERAKTTVKEVFKEMETIECSVIQITP